MDSKLQKISRRILIWLPSIMMSMIFIQNGLGKIFQIRLNPTRNFEGFKSLIIQSANSFKQYFRDFKFETEPIVIKVDGVDSIYFVGTFTMKTQNGEPMKVRSRTYAIPKDEYFFQLNFTDGSVSEDNSALFDNLIKTVNIN